MAQRLILKPDSLLQYTCFAQGSVAGLGLEAGSTAPYLRENFRHSAGGGTTSIVSRASAGYFNGCYEMQAVWEVLKCQDYNADIFLTFEDLMVYDPREWPRTCTYDPQERVDEWYLYHSLANPVPAAPAVGGGVEAVIPYLDRMTHNDDEPCAVPIFTGVLNFDGEPDAVCSLPGCYYTGSRCDCSGAASSSCPEPQAVAGTYPPPPEAPPAPLPAPTPPDTSSYCWPRASGNVRCSSSLNLDNLYNDAGEIRNIQIPVGGIISIPFSTQANNTAYGYFQLTDNMPFLNGYAVFWWFSEGTAGGPPFSSHPACQGTNSDFLGSQFYWDQSGDPALASAACPFSQSPQTYYMNFEVRCTGELPNFCTEGDVYPEPFSFDIGRNVLRE